MISMRQNGNRISQREEPCWKKPELGWVIANVDGAMGGSLEMVAEGGVIRDSDGNWIRGFARSNGVEVENDYSVAVESLNAASQEGRDCGIVMRMRGLLLREWETRVQFTHREANMVADRFANMIRGRSIGKIIHPEPPREVEEIVLREMNPVA
ncbi:hypothetical protein F3Y22_tig00110328pilonHSYRG01064 [Hibiscus syriacus]|uniref:Uncharacterized protein n=1 Tax=Hibiscus syriacus TaxID=106335 RepID=A0A6A3AZX9_HIBSY|nr:hypothetical protein F3Y22_tig00110328pilonHSYRG01064 [Hibiscus syriacus]